MFIFFDIDGTLIDHERASAIASIAFLDRFADVLPYSHEEFPSVWNTVLNKHFEMFSRGEVSFAEQRYNRMKELFRNPVLSVEEADASFQIYLQHYQASWSLFDDVMPCLERLTEKSLGIISNGNLDQQHKKLKQLGLVDIFSVIVISEAVGVSKPNPEIFVEACRRANVEAGDCVYVGDALEVDALASRAAGMKSIWLNRKGLPTQGLSIPVIATLSELEGILPKLAR